MADVMQVAVGYKHWWFNQAVNSLTYNTNLSNKEFVKWQNVLIKKKKAHKWKRQSDINQKRKHDLQWKKNQLVKQISETGVKVEIIIKEKIYDQNFQKLWKKLKNSSIKGHGMERN